MAHDEGAEAIAIQDGKIVITDGSIAVSSFCCCSCCSRPGETGPQDCDGDGRACRCCCCSDDWDCWRLTIDNMKANEEKWPEFDPFGEECCKGGGCEGGGLPVGIDACRISNGSATGQFPDHAGCSSETSKGVLCGSTCFTQAAWRMACAGNGCITIHATVSTINNPPALCEDNPFDPDSTPPCGDGPHGDASFSREFCFPATPPPFNCAAKMNGNFLNMISSSDDWCLMDETTCFLSTGKCIGE